MSMIVTYGLFTADKYELPLMYADTLQGLSIRTQIPKSTLYRSMVSGLPIYKKYKVEKIILSDG